VVEAAVWRLLQQGRRTSFGVMRPWWDRMSGRPTFTFSWSNAYTRGKGWSLWIVSTAVAPFPSVTAFTNSWRVCGTHPSKCTVIARYADLRPASL